MAARPMGSGWYEGFANEDEAQKFADSYKRSTGLFAYVHKLVNGDCLVRLCN